jgi:hypothetical protein
MEGTVRMGAGGDVVVASSRFEKKTGGRR